MKIETLSVVVEQGERKAIRKAAAELDMTVSPFFRALWLAYQRNPQIFGITKNDDTQNKHSDALQGTL